jgi:hypothetical protein
MIAVTMFDTAYFGNTFKWDITRNLGGAKEKNPHNFLNLRAFLYFFAMPFNRIVVLCYAPKLVLQK